MTQAASSSGGGTCAIRVAVRVRPLAASERRAGAKTFMNYFPESGQIALTASGGGGAPRMFAYDALFEPDASQDAVYETLAAPLLERIFGGYNATVIAYGQTGSGKTYTMGTDGGADSDQNVVGLTPRILNELFHTIQRSSSREFVVRCSMLEIYEERVIDLLSDEGPANLPLRENKGTVYVQNLTELPASSSTDALSLLERGCNARTKAETAMNAHSSRSHAVFTLNVHCTDQASSTSWRAKLCLVDLAGSERLKKTLATGDRLREGIKINEGLLVLGNCIELLSKAVPPSHVPYRDSKLTRLLQDNSIADSLGGNAATSLIACVSPADTNFEETLNTLRYAERAKRIKTKPIVNQDPMAAELLRLKALVQELQRERLETSFCPPAESNGFSSNQLEALRAEKDRLQFKLDELTAVCADAISARSNAQADAVQWESRYDKLVTKLAEVVGNIRCRVAFAQRDATFTVDENAAPRPDAASEEDDDLTGDDDAGTGDDRRTAAVEAFLKRQSAAQQRLAEMGHDIDAKNQLLAEYEGNGHTLAEYQEKLASLESTVDKLSKERDNLLSQLKRADSVGKVSEERRQRLKELESSLAQQRKQQKDFQRLMQMKARSDDDIKKLKIDIMALKKARVDLSKQLRQDSEKYRKWKMSADKRINQLQMAERRQAGQLAAAKRLHERQLTVYRRRYEEACHTNKRLAQRARNVDLLRTAHAKALKEQRQGTGDKCTEQAVARIKALLDDELSLCFDRRKATMQYDELVAHRTALTKRVSTLKRKLHKVEAKKPKSEDSEKEIIELQQRIDELTQQCELYSVEIRTLQCSLAQCDESPSQQQRKEVDGDAATYTTRWLDSLASCAELTEAVKHVFHQLVSSRADSWQLERKLAACQDSLEAYKDACDSLQTELDGATEHSEQAVAKCKEQLERAQADCQKQIAHVLSVFDRAAAGDALTAADRELLQSVDEEHRVKMQQTVEHLESEMAQLKEKLTEAQKHAGPGEETRRPRGRRIFKLAPGLTEDDLVVAPSSARKPKKPLQKTHTTRSGRIVQMTLDKWSESDDGSDENDSLDDSDYINTPLAKRPAARKASRAVGKRVSHDTASDSAPPAKKSDDKPNIVVTKNDDDRECMNTTFTLKNEENQQPATSNDATKAGKKPGSPGYDIAKEGIMNRGRQRKFRMPQLPGLK